MAYVRPSVCPLCYLLLNHRTKFNQIWLVCYSHEWGVQRQKNLPRPLGRGQKVKYHFISITKLISKIFILNFVFVLKMKDIEHIRRDFNSVAWVMPQGRTFGRWGCRGGSIFFFKHGHVAYQIGGDDEQDRMQVKFSS